MRLVFAGLLMIAAAIHFAAFLAVAAIARDGMALLPFLFSVVIAIWGFAIAMEELKRKDVSTEEQDSGSET